jgi:hypothetical protein
MPPLLRNEASNIFKGRDREHLKSNGAELTVIGKGSHYKMDIILQNIGP